MLKTETLQESWNRVVVGSKEYAEILEADRIDVLKGERDKNLSTLKYALEKEMISNDVYMELKKLDDNSLITTLRDLIVGMNEDKKRAGVNIAMKMPLKPEFATRLNNRGNLD